MSMIKIRAALETALNAIAPIIPAATITTVSAASPAVFTTFAPHLLSTGLLVSLSGIVGATPVLNGTTYFVVVLSPTTFTLKNTQTQSAINVTIAGNGGLVLANLTAWQNRAFQTALGVPYQLVDLMPARPDDPTVGHGYCQERGIFQVTLVYPLGQGVSAITTRAELIRTAFAKGSSFTNSGVTVQIPRTPELGVGYGDNDSFFIPVKIWYIADIFS